MNILFVSPVGWGALKQRHQGFAKELMGKGHQVFFLNPILSGGFSVTVHAESITTVTVKTPFKASSHPWLQKYAVKLALNMVLKRCHLKHEETVLWLAEPSCAAMTDYRWFRIIYDCCDLHGSFPGQKADVWLFYEKLISDRADCIIVSHPYIKQHFNESVCQKCVVIPNATSFTTSIRKGKPSENEPLKLLSSGAHYEWIDMTWLRMLAEQENLELHIAGNGRGREFEELLAMKNVIFHGALEQQDLLRIMAECHVGLVPFKNIELVKGVDPIKIYDYAATGLEIWAPDIEALHSNVYITHFVKNNKDVRLAISAYGAIKKPDLINKIPTWHNRLSNFTI